MLALRRLAGRHAAGDAAIAVAALQACTSGRLVPQLAAQLSTAAEEAAQEVDPDILVAQPRSESGSRAAERLRKEGRTPGILFSLPDLEERLVTFDAKAIKQQLSRLGRTGWACHVFNVQLEGADGQPAETVPALGRQVHMTADTDAIENVTLMYCPPERMVRVDVPLKVFGEESCPGIKAGGRINWIKRTIPCKAPGGRIPASFELDVSQMSMNDKVLLKELPLPEGVQLRDKNVSLPIIKIMK